MFSALLKGQEEMGAQPQKEKFILEDWVLRKDSVYFIGLSVTVR